MLTDTAPRRLTDARELRALAHPLRMAILEQLTVRGPMTATELGELTGESPANCSWHLRKLAEHGFVDEAEPRDGRQRPWRAAQTGMEWSEDERAGSVEATTAASALSRLMLEREVDRLMTAQTRQRSEASPWRESGSLVQSILWLTADELDEINGQLRDLLMSRADRSEDPSRRPEGARLCAFVAWGVPAEPARPDNTEDDDA